MKVFDNDFNKHSGLAGYNSEYRKYLKEKNENRKSLISIIISVAALIVSIISLSVG